MKSFLRHCISVLDPCIALLSVPAGIFLKFIRIAGIQYLPMTRNILGRIGVFPIRDHYYEPAIRFQFKYPLSQDRILPGIHWNHEEQIETLQRFHFSKELKGIPTKKQDSLGFHFNNDAFESGDAEYWYNMIRLFKPARIFEIGSGYSTLMAIEAIRQNRREDADYTCRHVCIEPYEMPWLERADVHIVRKKVEDVGAEFFRELTENDFLFIDSSHIIRPQGDVLFEYLELLPSLARGVVVHIHDIFSPQNYPREWIVDQVRFWNEQYLLEAFLTSNKDWKIVGALNYLHHHEYERLKAACPFLTPEREPGSFYIQKTA